MLEQLGYSVTLVTDDAAALGAVEAEPFDLVMTDIVMAGSLDGVGVTRALRQRKPDLPAMPRPASPANTPSCASRS